MLFITFCPRCRYIGDTDRWCCFDAKNITCVCCTSTKCNDVQHNFSAQQIPVSGKILLIRVSVERGLRHATSSPDSIHLASFLFGRTWIFLVVRILASPIPWNWSFSSWGQSGLGGMLMRCATKRGRVVVTCRVTCCGTSRNHCYASPYLQTKFGRQIREFGERLKVLLRVLVEGAHIQERVAVKSPEQNDRLLRHVRGVRLSLLENQPLA